LAATPVLDPVAVAVAGNPAAELGQSRIGTLPGHSAFRGWLLATVAAALLLTAAVLLRAGCRRRGTPVPGSVG
jgi:hypothetical protein